MAQVKCFALWRSSADHGAPHECQPEDFLWRPGRDPYKNSGNPDTISTLQALHQQIKAQHGTAVSTQVRLYPLLARGKKEKEMKLRFSAIAVVCVLMVLVSAAPAFAATVAVGTCLPNKVSFDSLGDAIQGVPPGSTILVCPGVYQEQLVISKSLTLKGQTSGNAAYPVIMPPVGGLPTNAAGLNTPTSFFPLGTLLAAQVVINNGAEVTMTDLAVDATGFNLPTCTPTVVGILIQDASATLNHVSIKNQLETGPPPCSATGNGAGVLAQNDSTGATTVKIINSSFFNAAQSYESDGASNTSTLTNNTFVGNPGSNANAISINTGNSTIQGNSITDFNYPPADVGGNINGSSIGIFMECVSSGTVANNVIGSSQLGIYLQNVVCPLNSNVSVTGNTVYNAFYIGIDVGETNGVIQGNDIRNTQTAIRIPGSAAGNTIQNNTINDTCAAFGSNPAAGVNTIGTNTIANAQNVAIVNNTGLCP
jgi:hypothetical protein